jgi:predicted nucleotidyltransferase
MRIGGLKVAVAALEDVIRSKEAANRPKDQGSLPVLRELLDEIRKRRG